jgi:hypothetical protein
MDELLLKPKGSHLLVISITKELEQG